MSEKFTITLGRECGAGATNIAQVLSKKLGIPYYDKDIFRMVSDKSGVLEEFFHVNNERPGNNLLYKIMAQGKADAAPVSTTDGQLATSKFQLVKDNKNIWPPYNLVPLANKQAVKRYPKMEKTLNKVDAKLTTKTVTQLNKEVGVDGQNYRTVAQNWYNKNMK